MPIDHLQGIVEEISEGVQGISCTERPDKEGAQSPVDEEVTKKRIRASVGEKEATR